MSEQTNHPRCILLVESDMPTALMLQDRIVAAGFSVLTAYSRERACELAACTRISDALIDMSLDGALEIAQILKLRNISYILHQSHPVDRKFEGARVETKLETVLAQTRGFEMMHHDKHVA